MRAVIVGAVLALMAALLGFAVLPGMFTPSMLTGAMLAQAGMSSSTTTSPSCDIPAMSSSVESNTAVQVSGLTSAQIEKSHIIWQTAHELGFGDRGALVADITFAQESTRGADPKTNRPDSNVDVGPFQQRALPGWYASGKTVEENVKILSDVRYAARTFFLGYKVTRADHEAAAKNGTKPAGPVGYITPGLKQVKNWQSMRPTAAAQAVQRSAYPEHYAKHEPTARQLIQRFNAEGAPPSTAAMTENPALCDPPGAPAGEVANCPDTGLTVEQGLTPDATRVLRCAYAQWPELTYYGVREDSMAYHPSGRAVDIMVPGNCAPLGKTIAEWARSNAEKLGVVDVIWCQQIWSVQRSKEGWRDMTDRGGNTANHKDHVHVTVAGNKAAAEVEAAPSTDGEQTGAVTVAPLDEYTLGAWHGKAGSVWSSGFHTGLDLGGPPAVDGKPIRAVQAGTIKQIVWHKAYGNLTVIDHGSVESWYAHASSTSGTVGQKVKPGDEIAKVGCTGNCFGSHLHLEIRKDGKPIDPDAWLSAQGVRLKGSRV